MLFRSVGVIRCCVCCFDRMGVIRSVCCSGRMGNTKQALRLITNELRDVDKAIEFCKEHDDRELWEDLISYSMDKPCTFFLSLSLSFSLPLCGRISSATPWTSPVSTHSLSHSLSLSLSVGGPHQRSPWTNSVRALSSPSLLPYLSLSLPFSVCVSLSLSLH